MWFGQQGPFELAAFDNFKPVRGCYRRGAHKRCVTLHRISDVRHLREKQAVVRFVVAVNSCPAGGEETWRTTHDIDSQAGVIGDRDEPGLTRHRACLEQCVVFERHAGFHDVRGACRARIDNLRVHVKPFDLAT